MLQVRKAVQDRNSGNAEMKDDLFDIDKPQEYIDYTAKGRDKTRSDNTMNNIRQAKPRNVPVVIGKTRIPIPHESATKLLAFCHENFNKGKSFKQTIIEMINETCCH